MEVDFFFPLEDNSKTESFHREMAIQLITNSFKTNEKPDLKIFQLETITFDNLKCHILNGFLLITLI